MHGHHARATRRRRDDPNPELFAYRAGDSWNDVKSTTVNEYLREVSGLAMSAKDFRTWHPTVLMASILARGPGPPPTRPPAAAARPVRVRGGAGRRGPRGLGAGDHTIVGTDGQEPPGNVDGG